MALLAHVWPEGPGKGKKKSLVKVLEKQRTQLWADNEGRAQHPAATSGNSMSVEKQTQGKAKPQGIAMAVFKTEQGEAAAGPASLLDLLGSAERDRGQSMSRNTEQECCSCPWAPK